MDQDQTIDNIGTDKISSSTADKQGQMFSLSKDYSTHQNNSTDVSRQFKTGHSEDVEMSKSTRTKSKSSQLESKQQSVPKPPDKGAQGSSKQFNKSSNEHEYIFNDGEEKNTNNEIPRSYQGQNDKTKYSCHESQQQVTNNTDKINQNLSSRRNSQDELIEESSNSHCSTDTNVKRNMDTEKGKNLNKNCGDNFYGESKKSCNPSGKDGKPDPYETECIKAKPCNQKIAVNAMDEKLGIPRVVVGEYKEGIKEKIILLVGASGSGKTTMVRVFYNMFFGIESPDENLTKHLPFDTENREDSRQITAYTFFSKEEDTMLLTIIDTPGLDDSDGQEIQIHAQELKSTLKNISDNKGEIHAIGFVAPAHVSRLTVSEKFVMDFVRRYMNISGNIITFITFADSQKTPPVIKAMTEYGLDTTYYFTFNNSVLCCEDEDEVTSMDKVIWRRGIRNCKKIKKLVQEMTSIQFSSKLEDENKCSSNKPEIGARDELVNENFITNSDQHTSPDPTNVLYSAIHDFIEIVDSKNLILVELNKKRDYVWECAQVIYPNHAFQGSNLQTFLFEHVHIICKSKKDCYAPHYMIILSLSEKRSLKQSTHGIIMGVFPIYKKAAESYSLFFRINIRPSDIAAMTRSTFDMLLWQNGLHELVSVNTFLQYLFFEIEPIYHPLILSFIKFNACPRHL